MEWCLLFKKERIGRRSERLCRQCGASACQPLGYSSDGVEATLGTSETCNYEFKGIREKAGLSKRGVSCRRLVCREHKMTTIMFKKFTHLKRRFWKAEPTFGSVFQASETHPHFWTNLRTTGLGDVILNLMQSTGLGQLYHPFDAISRALLFRQLADVSDHVTWDQRLPSCLSNNAREMASNQT
jgi:hypothetical protein